MGQNVICPFFRFTADCALIVIRLRPAPYLFGQLAPHFRQTVFDKMVTHCVGNKIPLPHLYLVDIYTSIISAGKELVEKDTSLDLQFRTRSKDFALSCWYEVSSLDLSRPNSF